jgi:hypothetical protein
VSDFTKGERLWPVIDGERVEATFVAIGGPDDTVEVPFVGARTAMVPGALVRLMDGTVVKVPYGELRK